MHPEDIEWKGIARITGNKTLKFHKGKYETTNNSDYTWC